MDGWTNIFSRFYSDLISRRSSSSHPFHLWHEPWIQLGTEKCAGKLFLAQRNDLSNKEINVIVYNQITGYNERNLHLAHSSQKP